ncbi:3-oxoacyl-[acyl-carrier protein] reductase [Bacillus oleivorans]|uniref:3-oxoacyl-[acyl-carrier protein] reductase n=1 Tax=Bacillus oleivorans TaxID=1448271 RepID=A0A285CMY8_9BACI|nr:SDR family oxidoreductase [Bacillus oleivorans]SNX68363.1 3-oxoacyl-[acyl-carrier protein] reductase [Bacillus oleivorans]
MEKKSAFITGGTKGLGKRTAEAMAAMGYDLYLNYRTEYPETRAWVLRLQHTYRIHVELVKGNMSILDDCKSVSRHIRDHVPNLAAVILNAGPYIADRKLLADYTENEWNELVNGNLSSAFYILKELIPVLRQNKGRIITFGFDKVESAPGWMFRSAFAAAKSGLASLTKSIAMEEAANGITANMICPGDITGEWKEKMIEEAIHFHDPKKPVGRPGTGEDIARMVTFLCDEKSDFITGSIFQINGGQDVLSKSSREGK